MVTLTVTYIDSTFRLCYVDPRGSMLAWFAPVAPTDMWGDDWNDAPYEHNAGDPYPNPRGATFDKDTRTFSETVELRTLAFTGPFSTPAQLAGLNSAYSVERINQGAIAWLTPDAWGPGKDARPILAGTSMDEFVTLVQAAGGVVYAPVED